jgi:predicted HAD superfamily Cof-like phosphohydrolase
MVEDVWRFHEAVGGQLAEGFTRSVLKSRRRFIEEEAREAIEALNDAEHEATLGEVSLDARRHLIGELTDLTYVIMGTFAALGVDPAPAWDAVHAANMRKEAAPVPGGKAVKPDGWRQPEIPLVPLRSGAALPTPATGTGAPAR